MQLGEYPATLSTSTDVLAFGLIATLESARSLSFVSIASSSAPTPAWTQKYPRAANGTKAEPPTAEQRAAVCPVRATVAGGAGHVARVYRFARLHPT